MRRAALVALDREQLRFTAAGVVLETGQDVLELARAPDSDRCPVRALEVWLRQARIDYGAVFRRVTAAGTLEDRLSPQGVWRILRRRAALARLRVPAGSRLSPDGLRASPRPQPHRPPAHRGGVDDHAALSEAFDAMPLAPADTDWLRNTLGVSGATEAVGRFQAAARGSGIIF